MPGAGKRLPGNAVRKKRARWGQPGLKKRKETVYQEIKTRKLDTPKRRQDGKKPWAYLKGKGVQKKETGKNAGLWREGGASRSFEVGGEKPTAGKKPQSSSSTNQKQ